MRPHWNEKFRTSVRQRLRVNRRCMLCCGKLRCITVITQARSRCSAASLALGLPNEAAILGDLYREAIIDNKPVNKLGAPIALYRSVSAEIHQIEIYY